MPFRRAFVIRARFGRGTSDILRRIRSRDPSFSAGACGFQEYAGIEPADTRSEPGPYIFGTFARTSATCSTVSAWDRKLREPRPWDLIGFASEVFGAPGFPNYSTTTASLASRTRHLQTSPPPFVFASSSPLSLRSSSAPSPPPLLPTVLALISENTTDSKISKRSRARNSEFHAMLIRNKVV